MRSAAHGAPAMAIATGNGYTPSPVPRVKILYVDRHCPRQPVMYEPGIDRLSGA